MKLEPETKYELFLLFGGIAIGLAIGILIFMALLAGNVIIFRR